MQPITPLEIDSRVKEFCESIVKDGKPVFLDFEAEPDTEILYN